MNAPARLTRFPALAAVAALAVACTSDPSADNQLRLFVGTSTGIQAAAPESVVVGNHRLVLDSVQLVLREIELKRTSASAGCEGPESAPGGPAASDGDGRDDDHRSHECAELEIGPLLVDVPLGGGPERVLSVAVDTGTYREVEFKLHRVGSMSEDNAFVRANPGFDGVSVRAVGTYDGTPFVFVSDVSAQQETHLDPPLEVTAGAPADLTLTVEVGSWFLAGGVGLIDPATAGPGGQFAGLVRDNIRRSFRTWRGRHHEGDHD